MNTENQDIRYSVILPKELNEKVETEARTERRSKAQQINYILEKFFEEKEQRQSAMQTEPAAFT